MKHISDNQYKGHEIVVLLSLISGHYAVDIRSDNFDGAYLAGFTGFTAADDALKAGTTYIDGYIDGARGYQG